MSKFGEMLNETSMYSMRGYEHLFSKKGCFLRTPMTVRWIYDECMQYDWLAPNVWRKEAEASVAQRSGAEGTERTEGRF